MGTYFALWFLFFSPFTFMNPYKILGIVFLFTALMPVAFILFYNIKDIYLNDRKSRGIPILFTAFAYAACYILLKNIFGNVLALTPYILSLAIGLFLIWIINFGYK